MTDISYKGANYIAIQTKQALVVVDPVVPGMKASKVFEKANVQLATQPQFGREAAEGQRVFSLPGEYEAADMSIVAFDATAQLENTASSVVYKITTPDCSIGVIGHINPDTFGEEQLEKLGMVDILVIPVGGNGYTVDPHGAVKLTRHISPKVVIPVHYQEDGVDYEMPQQSLENFTRELGVTPEQQSSLKIKQAGQLPEVLGMVQLEKTAA